MFSLHSSLSVCVFRCWVWDSAFYGAFLTPVALIVLLNIIMFIRIIYVLHNRLQGSRAHSNRDREILQRLRSIFAVMCLIGLTWVFGFLTISTAKIVYQYLFVVFNSSQGLFIFLFHCALKSEVRKAWKECLCTFKGVRFGRSSEQTGSFGLQSSK